nr:hypothetical protein Iba_chr10cCG9120 [Ipomoea batatas]
MHAAVPLRETRSVVQVVGRDAITVCRCGAAWARFKLRRAALARTCATNWAVERIKEAVLEGMCRAEQTEKTKRMGVLSEGRKPVGKVELGEMRILFFGGRPWWIRTSKSEKKEEIFFGCCWDEVNSGLKRKITKKIEGKDMVGARASLDEEEGSDGAFTA